MSSASSGSVANMSAHRNTAGWKRVTIVVNAESSPAAASDASCASRAYVARSEYATLSAGLSSRRLRLPNRRSLIGRLIYGCMGSAPECTDTRQSPLFLLQIDATTWVCVYLEGRWRSGGALATRYPLPATRYPLPATSYRSDWIQPPSTGIELPVM